VIGFLRFLGVINAAVWFGSAIFFTFVVVPGVFSPEMKTLFEQKVYFNGGVAQILISRYFVLQHCCAVIAIFHLVAEKLYAGRGIERLTLLVVTGMLGAGLLGGFWIQPKLKELHSIKYQSPSLPARAEADRAFKSWHGISQMVNLAMLPGLIFYLWRVTSVSHPSRLPGFRKLNIGWK
jgi:hypothetical protein